MPDLDLTHALVAAVASLPGVVALIRKRTEQRGDAYDDARRDLDECRERSDKQDAEIEALKSSNGVLMRGLDHLQRDHETLKSECAERDLAAATERERDRRVIAGLRDEMDGLRRSITGDAR